MPMSSAHEPQAASPRQLWDRYRAHTLIDASLGFRLDISRMRFGDSFLDDMEPRMQAAFAHMQELEAGAIANPDEQRMVGHSWLRDASLAPTPELRQAIDGTVARIKAFAADVHAGRIAPPGKERFTHLLVVGIGGSALGPQLVASALTSPDDQMRPHFFDNTDPDGFDRTLAAIGDHLPSTLVVVISKSGGTKETRNGQLEARAAFERAGLDFASHVVAVTGEGSELDRTATAEGWLERFPMWDWVGGRTSELSAVGLLPAALQGLDIDAMLAGAAAMDQATRTTQTRRNSAALMALMWHYAGGGRGLKDMVVLPYKDRLELFSRYLQQLVMESLGKEHDLQGNVVNQGIAVYGNKGSTDQHAYVQQLRDGVSNFFVTFIEVLTDRRGNSLRVEPDVTAGDYLQGFLLGTRRALYEKGRESITLTFDVVDAATVGKLIALYERTVGLYAHLVGINAYHQPGVEAGKKAAGEVIAMVSKIITHLRAHKGQDFSLEELAQAIGAEEQVETVFHVLEHLAINTRIHKQETDDPFSPRYC